MNLYRYKDKFYTVRQLTELSDCLVTPNEFRENFWKKKYSIEKSLVTPCVRIRDKSKVTYIYNGVPMTIHEITNLRECEISIATFRAKLRANNNVFTPELLKRKKGEVPRTISDTKEYSKEQIQRKIDCMEKSKTRQSTNGQITFSGKSQATYRNEYDYFQVALDRMQIAVKDGKLDISKFLKKRLE